MAVPFFTPVRRNHIVGPAGVGSILVTRNGVTVLVCGLPTWLASMPTHGPDERARRVERRNLLGRYELHDHNAEKDLGVSKFLLPPVVDEDPSYRHTWFVPAIRFPLSEYCHNPSCKMLTKASVESPSVGQCSDCSERRKSRRQQVPVVLICPAGHLDELDFTAIAHPSGICSAPKLAYHVGQNITAPEIKCVNCNSKGRVEASKTVPCTGARPWLVGAAAEKCDAGMRVIDRTSTSVYFPDVRSYLHIPAATGLRDTVLRWLEDDPIVAGREPTDEILQSHARALFPDLTLEDLRKHLEHLRAPRNEEAQSRAGELKALTSGTRGVHTSDGPPVLDAELISPNRYNEYVGEDQLISRVAAVHRLAETRAIAGFTRVEPPSRAPNTPTGFSLMWGHEPGRVPDHDWLPGVRVYGEGILLELNSRRVETWAKAAEASLPPIALQGEVLTAEFQLAHTLAHLLMNAAALQCGYPVASLRDRIYALPDRTALLIYTGDGDVLGTMGGLVELAQPGYLEPLVDSALANAQWCGLDPVCISPVGHIKNHRAGACHQCCLLPETSCSWWNRGLDRATLIGRGAVRGYL